MIPKTLLAFLVGLALLAGPIAAACGSCCPPVEDRATFITAGCCDCGQTIERPSAPDSSVSGRSTSPEAVGFAAQVPVPAMRTGSLLLLLAGDRVFSPPSPPTPRRL